MSDLKPGTASPADTLEPKMSQLPLVAIIAASLILVGCSQAGYPNQPGIAPTTSLVTARTTHPIKPDRKASWMNPNRIRDRLIYVSDAGTDDVNIYGFTSHNLVGQLTGFNEPQGMCGDSHGNVYIANTLDSNIVEYAHGGTSPIRTFDDPGLYPVDCAVIRFGTVVAANEGATNGGPGSLSYFNGTQLSNTITFSRLPKISSIGYLPAVGFNFMIGLNADGNSQYAKYRFALNLISLPIASPGAVRFSGIEKYMAVGDQSGDVYLVHGSTVSKTIKLNGLCAAGQFSITHRYIIVPDPCGGDALIYPFPAGGVAYYKLAGLNDPVGTAVSEDGLRGP